MHAAGALKLAWLKGTRAAKEALFLGEGPWKLPGSCFIIGGLTPVHVDSLIREVSDRDAGSDLNPALICDHAWGHGM